jgi:hypothetical protein
MILLSRRTVLKILGSTLAVPFMPASSHPAPALAAPTLTAPTAPIYIPASHLDWTSLLERPHEAVRAELATTTTNVRVQLQVDTFVPQLGGRLRTGSVLEVTPRTAARWLKHKIARPAPRATMYHIVQPGDLNTIASRPVSTDRFVRDMPTPSLVWGNERLVPPSPCFHAPSSCSPFSPFSPLDPSHARMAAGDQRSHAWIDALHAPEEELL